MQLIENKVHLVTVDINYVRVLHQVSNEVQYAIGYENKPYVGIFVQNNNFEYVIPLSSAKEKHKQWKDVTSDCFVVFEMANISDMSNKDIYISMPTQEKPKQVKHILSIIDLKKMIPVKTGVYEYVDINPCSTDSESIVKYKDLLSKELQFCIKIKDDLVKNADKIYQKQKRKGFMRFCIDFQSVENACEHYQVN